MTARTGSVFPDHAATFYDADADLVAEIAEWAAAGLDVGERVVLVATPEHLAAMDEVLVQYGIDADEARASGILRSRDAAGLLFSFVSDAGPDPLVFAGTVAPIIDAATSDGSRVRIYGEMVALLWEQGDVAGALQLEALWNALASTHSFALRCGYPASALGSSLFDAHGICQSHARVIAPRSYWSAAIEAGADSTSERRESEVFLPVPAAIPAARRFVATTLRSWDEEAVVGDGTLVVSELATNAVRHADSPFRVSMQRTVGGVRIGIEDIGEATPAARVAAPEESGGRGVQIVERLAHRWGWDTASTGKVVWAELAR